MFIKAVSRMATPAVLALLIAAGSPSGSQAQSTEGPFIPTIPVINIPTPPPVVKEQPTPPPISTIGVSIPTFTPGLVPTDVTRLNRLQAPIVQLPTKLDGFIFALATCQGVEDKNKGSVIYPVRGTLYSNDEKAGVKLARGRMLVIAGDKSARVETNALTVEIEPGSSAIVETGLNGLTRVFSTAAYEKSHQAATVSFANGKEQVALKVGDAIIAADHDISNEELIPIDGIDQRPISGQIAALPKNVRLVEYSLKQMTNRNLLIACRPLDIHPSSKSGQALKQAHEQALAAAEKQAPFDGKNSLQGVAEMQDSTKNTMTSVAEREQSFETIVDERGRSVIARRNSIFKLSGNQLDLELGTLLVSSTEPLNITGCGRIVSVTKGATALIQSNGTSLKVINLTDKANNSVAVINAGKRITVTNGQEVLLSTKPPTLSDVFDNHRIGHRALHSQDLGADGWLTLSHVNLQDELVHHPLLKQVHHARDLNVSKRIVGQIMLTAAIMNTMGANRTSFQQGLPEDEKNGAGAVIAAHCSNCSL
jgi:hypothetical protein